MIIGPIIAWSSNLSDRSSKSSNPRSLADQPGAPAGLFADPVNKFAEIYGTAMVGHSRMFVVAVCMSLVAIVAVVGALTIANRSTAVPFYVQVNDDGGVKNVPVKMESIRPNQAVIKAELAKFIIKVFTIDPALTPGYFKAANVMTSGLATTQFTEFRVEQNINTRMAKETELTRTASVTSVDISQPGVAFVFLVTNEAQGASKSPSVAKWRVTLKYELQPPKSEEEILINPLGLFVVGLNIIQEGKQ